MTLTVRAVPFGQPAATTLRLTIADGKRGDVLAPVTVMVPRGPVGLSVRRLLSSERLGPPPAGTRPGLLNVRFVTLPRVVHDIAGPSLERTGRRPLTDAVLTAAAIEAVRSAQPVLGTSDTPPAAMARAVAATWRELRGVPAATRHRLAAQSERAAAVLGVVQAVSDLLVGWYDDADAAFEACLQLADPANDVGTSTGSVVWYLPPTPPAPWAPPFVRALTGRVPVAVLLGITGEVLADEPAHHLCRQLGVDPAGVGPREPAVVGGGKRRPPRVSVVNAPSADAEVLLAVRGVVERLTSGVPAERIAVVDGGGPSYRRQVRELLTVSGIPFHGGAVRTLAVTVPGRTLLGLFELAERGWRREDVIGWMSAAPLRDSAGPIPATHWDRLSRTAGITSGLGDWRARLDAHQATQRERLDRAVASTAGGAGSDVGAPDARSAPDQRDLPGELDATIDRLRHQVAQLDRLRRFIDHVAALLEDEPHTWEGWAQWCLGALDGVLGGSSSHRSWPDVEVQARDAVREAVTGLASLDRLAPTAGTPTVDAATWRAALTAELDAPAPDVTRTGRGIMVGHVDELIGLDVDVAFVVGMVDGVYPTLRRDDPLLPDRVRSAVGSDVPLRTGRQSEARRRHLAAMAGARELVLSFARGDQRQGRQQRPARWLLDALETRLGDGRRLYSRDLLSFEPFDGYRVVESFTASVCGHDTPASLADADLRSVTVWQRTGRLVSDHPLVRHDPVLARGLEAQAARRASRFTRFDGLVEGVPLSSPADTPQSPTGLERYAACPRRYFLSRILRVRAHDRPEAVVRIEPSDRGTVVHRILERFISTTFLGGEARTPGAPYTASDLEELARITAEELVEAERQGLTGAPVLWRLDRASIVRDVERFPAEDHALRAELRSAPEAVELSFGPQRSRTLEEGAVAGTTQTEVAVPTPHGVPVRFRGMIDRVDRTSDGGAVVIDYKTGAPYELREIEEDAARGRRLQLPIYALAASATDVASSPAAPGTAPARPPVRALYWYVSERGGFARAELEFDEPAYERLVDMVSSMVESIAAGVFAANPGPLEKDDGAVTAFRNCRFCEFDTLCPRDRRAEWVRKHRDPVMSTYTRWAER